MRSLVLRCIIAGSLALLLSALHAVSAQEADLMCSACRVVVHEIQDKIREAEAENKMVDSGSFRIDSSGNNNIKKVPYARSVTHLTSVLENVCQQLFNYGQMVHPEVTGKRGFVPLTYSNGSQVNTTTLSTGPQIENILRMRCENIVDDHEEDIITALRRSSSLDTTSIESEVCSKITTVCSPEDLQLVFSPPVQEPQSEENTTPSTTDSSADADAAKDEDVKETPTDNEKSEVESSKEEL